jgi:hypothetical protein
VGVEIAAPGEDGGAAPVLGLLVWGVRIVERAGGGVSGGLGVPSRTGTMSRVVSMPSSVTLNVLLRCSGDWPR